MKRIETHRIGTTRNELNPIETKQNRNETKRIGTTRNGTKRNECEGLYIQPRRCVGKIGFRGAAFFFKVEDFIYNRIVV